MDNLGFVSCLYQALCLAIYSPSSWGWTSFTKPLGWALFTKPLGWTSFTKLGCLDFVHHPRGRTSFTKLGSFGLCSPPQGEDFLHQTGVIWTLFTTPGGGLPSPNWGRLDFVYQNTVPGLTLPKWGCLDWLMEVMFCLVVVRRTHMLDKEGHIWNECNVFYLGCMSGSHCWAFIRLAKLLNY